MAHDTSSPKQVIAGGVGWSLNRLRAPPVTWPIQASAQGPRRLPGQMQTWL